MRLIHYNYGAVLRHDQLPGMQAFRGFFDIYSRIAMPVDRSEIIKTPVRMKSLFPLPEMRNFTKDYEDLCNERAQTLLLQTEKNNTELYLFWSGGIDSTCVLVSLLKNATRAQKERIVVLLSEDSINEYPLFYREHIRGKLRRESAMLFPYLLGGNKVVLTADHNDQLFGSDVIGRLITRFGFEAVMRPYDRQMLSVFFEEQLQGDKLMAASYVRLFERLKDSAPVILKTNFDLFWWINFTIKWQTVFMCMLSYTARRNQAKITGRYVREHRLSFFNTNEFQLWSMNNLDKRIKGDWRSYKWPAKKIIYDFTKDPIYYETKTKRGSLYFLILCHQPASFIDERFKFHDNLEPEAFYEPDNDFVRPAASAPLTWSESVDALRPQM